MGFRGPGVPGIEQEYGFAAGAWPAHCLTAYPSQYMYIPFTKSVNSTSVPVLVQWVLRHIQTVGMHPKAAYPYSLSRIIGVLL